jgi:hypothetical protein
VSRHLRVTLFLAASVAVPPAAAAQQTVWPQHSPDRPRPPVVTPAPVQPPAHPPSDAIVLFGGRSLREWQAADSIGGPARWRVTTGAFEVVPGTGAIRTTRSFGDVQLHVEWMSPLPAVGSSQDRGNSGVFLMERYEVQILDSYASETYADGQAASIYGQFPPYVNASRPPGRWQSFDIIFRAPKFDGSRLTVPARMTVFHNGILVHEDVVLLGPTSNGVRAPYVAHPDRLPIRLQDHGHRVRFRNIWVRELAPADH